MIYIVLPAFNEEATIGLLLQRLSFVLKEQRLLYKVVVVNDGSKDKTQKIIKSFQKKMPVILIDHTRNRGLNDALRTGLLEALRRAKDTDIIITMDADNSHAPGLILQMTRMIQEGADVVIASRYLPQSQVRGLSLKRKTLSIGASLLLRMCFPIQGIKDYTSGYRAYNAILLKKAFRVFGKEFINQPGFSSMVDILLKLRTLDAIMTEAPLILRYDLKTSKSKMNIGKTVKETLNLIIKRRFLE